MKTIAELDREINECLAVGNDRRSTDRQRSNARGRIVFLNMCKRYLETANEQSIRNQLIAINKTIAIHEQRIADAQTRIEKPGAKLQFAVDYGKRVGLPKIRDYQKSLSFIVDDAILSPQ